MRVADARLVRMVHRDRPHPRSVLARRGDAAVGRDVHRLGFTSGYCILTTAAIVRQDLGVSLGEIRAMCGA